MDKSPFVTSVDKRSQSDAAKSRLALGNSDQLTLYSAFVRFVRLNDDALYMSTVECTKVPCPLFVILGDSLSIFPSLDKMWNFNLL